MTLPEQEGGEAVSHGAVAQAHGGDAAPMPMAEEGMEHGGMHHEMGTISMGESVTIVVATFLILLFAVWFTSYFIAPISFTR